MDSIRNDKANKGDTPIDKDNLEDGASRTEDKGNRVVFNALLTFENGLHVDGPQREAEICIDNEKGTMTITPKGPAMVFTGPYYPILIEGLLPRKEEKKN